MVDLCSTLQKGGRQMQGIAACAGPEPVSSAAPHVQGNPGFWFKTLYHHPSSRWMESGDILAEWFRGQGDCRLSQAKPSPSCLLVSLRRSPQAGLESPQPLRRKGVDDRKRGEAGTGFDRKAGS